MSDPLGDRLVRQWVAFARLLRRNGVATTPAQLRDLLRTLAAPEWSWAEREQVYLVARALLCARHEDWPRFDLIFRQFWGRTHKMVIPSDQAAPRPETHPVPGTPPPPAADRPPAAEGAPEERIRAVDTPDLDEAGALPAQADALLRYSAAEQLRHQDFAAFSDEEVARARALMAYWRWQPGVRRTRRLVPARRGRRLHTSRTLRRAMRTGGVPLALAWRGPRTRPRPLVLICDISGSMAPYTRVVLHFLYTLSHGLDHVEVFVFGTRLTRITRALRARTVDAALAEVGHTVEDWAGGTRIGEAVRAFNTQWARRVLGQGAVVCLISDGWDRGDPALLAAEMAHLQRLAFRLFWLNPLLGLPGYQPLTRGMAAALPFVDDFLPANNLRGLEALLALLERIPPTRPGRKQVAAAPGG